jgi:hypothetical protein
MLSVSELRELAGKVTPLPWEWENSLWDNKRPYNLQSPNGDFHPLIVLKTPEEGWPPTDDDAAYIVAAVNALPSILDRLEEAEAENERLRALQFAVGNVPQMSVPESVYRAWRDSVAYRRDTLKVQDERIDELENVLRRIRRSCESDHTNCAAFRQHAKEDIDIALSPTPKG